MAENRCEHGWLSTAPRCPYGCYFGVKRTSKPKRYRPRDPSGKRHSGFVDMTGQVCGTWTVLEEASPSDNGTVRWRARHACGAVHVVEGIKLRNAPPEKCRSCRPRSFGEHGRIGEVSNG